MRVPRAKQRIENPVTDRLNRILEREMRTGLTKTEVAARMGTAQSQLNRILDPNNSNQTLSALRRLSEVLGVEMDIRFIKRRK